jgi:hypothetical protein
METEASALISALDGQRQHVLGILDGLAGDVLRRPVLPSGWTCLGMVSHLTVADERFWFQGIVAGDPAKVDMTEEGQAWQVPAGTPATAVLDAYRQEFERSNEIIRATPLDTPPALWPADVWSSWRLPDLRAVILHVITETACHAGHLDAARELIDGRQWQT